MINFFFKFMEGPRQLWEGPEFAERLGAMLDDADHPRYKRVQDPDQADVIVLVESNVFKERHYLDVLDREPLLQQWPQKCFTLNYDDDALGLLAGIYVGLPRQRFDPLRHRASCYVHPPNPRTAAKAVIRDEVEPLHLASFRGAISHPFRRQLLETKALGQLGPITHIDRWFNHTEDEKESYLDEILASKFVLCPRGCSPSSIRLFEVMELGRVPVILADEWVPPEGPAWSQFSIRVAESRVRDLPRILAEREYEWKEMARAARRAWEEWFGPQTRIVSMAVAIEALLLTRPSAHWEGKALRSWKTHHGRRKLGWTLSQRVWRRFAARFSLENKEN
jgi:hypothetical protein